MNKKLTLSALVVVALMVASMQMAVFAVGNGVTPLGLEIAGKADEIASGLQTDIQDFITQKQLMMAETAEERLVIIEEKKAELTLAIEAASIARQELIEAFEASEKTEEDRETFVAGMRGIATDISGAAKLMGELGDSLGNLGQELAGTLKEDAQTLLEEIEGAESDIEAEGTAIAEEMSGLNLPIPDNLPGIPDEVPPTGLSEPPEEIPPTDLPPEVPEVPPTDVPPEVPEIPPVPLP